MRTWPICLALLLGACTGSNSATYTFSGCDDAGSSGDCHADGVFDCASQRIIAKFNSCTTDADCVLVQPQNTGCVFFCQVAVRADEAGNFNDEFLNESQRYCASDDHCEAQSDSCFSEDGPAGAVCSAGHCIVGFAPDAGF